MKRINIAGITATALMESGKLPRDLKWSSDWPSSYSIHLIKNEEKTKTIVVLSDGFGGKISWAKFDGNIDLAGCERHLEMDEINLLGKYYPDLVETMKDYLK